MGTEEEAAEVLEAVLGMEVEEDRDSEGEEGGDGTQRALGALEFLTQDSDPSGTTLVDSHNGFNDLSCLAMMWTMRHHWPAGVRLALNCYRHWEQLILRQPGDPPVTILSREGVTQGDPLLMVLYRITLVPIYEELRAADPGLLSPFYTDDAASNGLTRRSAHILKLLMKMGPDRGYFPKPANSLFVLDTPSQEEAAKQEFAIEGLTLNFGSGSRYLGSYLGPRYQLEAWVKPQVEAWAHEVIVLGQISRRHP